jgi:hypothetical protein
MPRRMSVWPAAIHTRTPLGIGIIVAQNAQNPPKRIGVDFIVDGHAAPRAKLDFDHS